MSKLANEVSFLRLAKVVQRACLKHRRINCTRRDTEHIHPCGSTNNSVCHVQQLTCSKADSSQTGHTIFAWNNSQTNNCKFTLSQKFAASMHLANSRPRQKQHVELWSCVESLPVWVFSAASCLARKATAALLIPSASLMPTRSTVRNAQFNHTLEQSYNASFSPLSQWDLGTVFCHCLQLRVSEPTHKTRSICVARLRTSLQHTTSCSLHQQSAITRSVAVNCGR